MMLEEPNCVDVFIHPMLKTLEVTQENLSTVLESAHNITGITFLTLHLDLKRQTGLEPQILSFVGSLSNLTALKVSTCCTDNLLAVLGLFCHNLKIFDAEADTEMSVTDRGLAFLTSCRLLESIILNDEGTEYDEEDRYPALTGPGVANFLMALPNLSLLVIDPHLLKEAIKFLHSVNVHSKTFSLRYMHLRFTSKDFLYTVADMFPKLSTLRLEEPSKDVSQSLSQIRTLDNLTLSCYAWNTINEIQMKTSLENLRVLMLRNPKIMGIDINFLKNLGKWCVHLESLTIALYSEVFLTSSQRISTRDVFFPKLKCLMFEGDISIFLIETILFAVKNLEKLSIYVHGFNFSPGVLDQLLLNLVKNGNLTNLEYLQCYHWEVSLETLLYLIDQSVYLRTVWGLNMLTLCDKSKETIKNHIKKNNLNIDIFDGLAPEQTFGLEFFDQKFSRKFDRLHEYNHQIELENILMELNLL